MSGRRSISEYYHDLLESLKSIVYKNDALIVGRDTDRAIKELLEKSQVLQPIEFDSSRPQSVQPRKEMRIVPAERRDPGYRSEGDLRCEYEVIEVTIPIVRNTSVKNMRDLKPATFSVSWLPEEFVWDEREVKFSVEVKGYRFAHGDEEIVKQVERAKQHLRDWTEAANRDINQQHEALSASLFTVIEGRRKQLAEDEERFGKLSEKLGMSLKKE